MNRVFVGQKGRISVFLAVFVAFAILMGFSALAQADSASSLQDRPTPSVYPDRPTLTPTSGSAGVYSFKKGAIVELQVNFDSDWPWYLIPWYDLWTVVQWQDGLGYWHDVEGWQANLESISADENGLYMAYVRHWLSSELFGRGPFRWIVYDSYGGERLVISEEFYLPDIMNRMRIIEVDLVP